MVYIREAHPLDGAMAAPRMKDHPLVEEPLSIDERKAVARTCSGALDLSPLRMVIDDMNDTTCNLYSAWPDRLYLVGWDGRIAFAGDPGPRGFKLELLEDAIRKERGLPPREAK